MHMSYKIFASTSTLALRVILFAALSQTALAGSDESSIDAAAPTASPSAPARMSGQKVYNEVCIACHAPPGVGGAPALGNREAWAPRIEQGTETLIQHALNGFTKTGVMPKKGGRVDLSDEEIIGAVEFMLEQVSP